MPNSVWAQKSTDVTPVLFAPTQTGIQAALDYCGGAVGSIVVLGPGDYTITNLTMHGKTTLKGFGALVTRLNVAAGTTGIVLREKTAGEGNISGATGITVAELGIYGVSTLTAGIDFGNQGGASFNANAQLWDVLVRDVTGGTGIKLLANAIHCRNIWAANCSIGVWLNYNAGGGANHIDGVWAEQCSDTHLKVDQPWNTIVHAQIEQSGSAPTNPLIDLSASTADRNVFCGVYCSFTVNLTNLIRCRTGVIGTQFYGIRINSTGHTYTNTVFTEGTGVGTGAQDWIGFFNDMSNTGKHYMNDQTLGEVTVFTGARPVFPQASIGTLAVTATSAFTGDITAGVAGTGYSATFGQGAAGADFSTVRSRSGSGGGLSQFLLNQNNVDLAGLRYAGGQTFLDHGGTLSWRNGISGPTTATLTTAGNFAPVGSLTCPTTIQVGGGDVIAKVQANVYTPTRSAEVNMDANVTLVEAQYVRVGNTVTVSGRFTADPTAAAAASFEMTLPVASNITNVEDVAGVAFCGAGVSQGAEVIGVPANDTAKVQWIAADLASRTWSYTFTYQVI